MVSEKLPPSATGTGNRVCHAPDDHPTTENRAPGIIGNVTTFPRTYKVRSFREPTSLASELGGKQTFLLEDENAVSV